MNENMNQYVFHAWLASASLTPEMLGIVLKEFQTPEDIYQAFQASDSYLFRSIPESSRRVLTEKGTPDELERMGNILETHQIGAFTIVDPLYPKALADISDPPGILFYQGNPDCLSLRSIAIVGSRAASYAGKKAAQTIARDLSKQRVCIVSGMAEGIDTAAHKGCLEGGSPTIAITGCGLDTTYPMSNIQLKKEILSKGGLLLSEYAPKEKPLGWHFPVRNRIITGITKALVLIEARIRSGSVISVQHALNQGKDVFVYPGDPTLPHFEGNHQLLREGALYFTTAGDILEDLGWLDNHMIIGQNIDCSTDLQNPAGPDEAKVVNALKSGNLSFEQLLAITGLSPASLMSTLTVMQIKKTVEALPGKQYGLVRHM